jgi:hypothetical protein
MELQGALYKANQTYNKITAKNNNTWMILFAATGSEKQIIFTKT